jgi:large subunit ribosomal protein L30
MAAMLEITQVKSSNGASKKQLGSLRTLGLGRIGKQVERPDDAVVRGLVASVDHLVKVGNDG